MIFFKLWTFVYFQWQNRVPSKELKAIGKSSWAKKALWEYEIWLKWLGKLLQCPYHTHTRVVRKARWQVWLSIVSALFACYHAAKQRMLCIHFCTYIFPYQEIVPLKRKDINDISYNITIIYEGHFGKVSIKLKKFCFIAKFGRLTLEKWAKNVDVHFVLRARKTFLLDIKMFFDAPFYRTRVYNGHHRGWRME